MDMEAEIVLDEDIRWHRALEAGLSVFRDHVSERSHSVVVFTITTIVMTATGQ